MKRDLGEHARYEVRMAVNVGEPLFRLGRAVVRLYRVLREAKKRFAFEIQALRSLFSTRRLYQKRNTQLKNRIHSLLKEGPCGFTREEIGDKKSREHIRKIASDPALRFPINQLRDRLERDEADGKALKGQVLLHAGPFTAQGEI
jgi:hypothetical protein